MDMIYDVLKLQSVTHFDPEAHVVRAPPECNDGFISLCLPILGSWVTTLLVGGAGDNTCRNSLAETNGLLVLQYRVKGARRLLLRGFVVVEGFC